MLKKTSLANVSSFRTSGGVIDGGGALAVITVARGHPARLLPAGGVSLLRLRLIGCFLSSQSLAATVLLRSNDRIDHRSQAPPPPQGGAGLSARSHRAIEGLRPGGRPPQRNTKHMEELKARISMGRVSAHQIKTSKLLFKVHVLTLSHFSLH